MAAGYASMPATMTFALLGYPDALFSCGLAGTACLTVSVVISGYWGLIPVCAATAAIIACLWRKNRRGKRKRRAPAATGAKTRALIAKLARSLKPVRSPL